MVALQAALLAGAAALAARWWALPGALVLLEAAQSRFSLGGFPLPGLVHSQPDGPFVLAAPLGGSCWSPGWPPQRASRPPRSCWSPALAVESPPSPP